MAKQPDSPPRTAGRKPQINLEATAAEKIYFERLAKAHGMKLAALVRQLLDEKAKSWNVPTLLADYKNPRPDAAYQYQVTAQEASETKLGIFRQFLQAFKSDCDFSIDVIEPNQYADSVTCIAYSSSGENTNKLQLGLAPKPEDKYREQLEIRNIWHDVLGLSLLLEDKWNGVNYIVEARRTLKGKKILLQKFVEEHRGAILKSNATYNGGSVFKVVADTEEGSKELLIEYLPQRVGEAAELQQALEEYQQAAHH